MASKRLGNLLRSVPPATATVEPPAPVAAPVPEQAAARAEPRGAPKQPAAALELEEVPLQVLIPAHVRKQLALLVAEQGGSLRGHVLRAFRSLGITVTDADIAGKRGLKKS